MGLTKESVKKQNFLERARGLRPETRSAIERIVGLPLDVAGVDVEFTNNEVDHSVLVRFASLRKTAALLKIESSGRLMLMTAHHEGCEGVQQGLNSLALKLGEAPTPDWRKKKPTFLAGRWESGIDAIVQTVTVLARSNR